MRWRGVRGQVKAEQYGSAVARHDETVAEVRGLVRAVHEALIVGDARSAVADGREAFRLARGYRAHQLLSEAWVAYIEALDAAVAQEDADAGEYAEVVEGGYAWGETMPEEIQRWFMPFLVPHLEAIGERRHAQRAAAIGERAAQLLGAGRVNVGDRCRQFHLDDLEAGRVIDPAALAAERRASFYVDELFDPGAEMLAEAAGLWRSAGRPDRAAHLDALVAAVRRLPTPRSEEG